MESARRFEPAARKYSTSRLEREEEEFEEEDHFERDVEEEHYEDASDTADFTSFREQPDDFRSFDTANLNMQAESAYKLAVRKMNREDTGYRLEITQPKKPIEDDYDVLEHYQKLYEMKQTSLLPHLQPNNMRPYGSTDTIVFPPNKPKRFAIYYPEFNESQEMLEESAKASTVQQREYSTLQKSESVPVTQTKRAPYHQGPKAQKLLQVQENSIRHVSPRGKHDHSAQSVKAIVPTASEDIEKCNKIISEFKKLNPDSELKKTVLLPGSPEEKEALNNAFKFASEYRKKYLAAPSSSADTTATDDNLAESSEEIAETGEDIIEESEEAGIEAARKGPLTVEKLRALSRTILGNRTSIQRPLPVVAPSVPIKLTQVPRLNVLQSSALPEDGLLLDNIKTEENERLIAPWPSYSDALKLLSRKNVPEVTAPAASRKSMPEVTGTAPATTATPELKAVSVGKIPIAQTRGLSFLPDFGLSR